MNARIVRYLVIGFVVLVIVGLFVGSSIPNHDSPTCRTYKLVRDWGDLKAGETYTTGCTFIYFGGPPPAWAVDSRVSPPPPTLTPLPSAASTATKPAITPQTSTPFSLPPTPGPVTQITTDWATTIPALVIIVVLIAILGLMSLVFLLEGGIAGLRHIASGQSQHIQELDKKKLGAGFNIGCLIFVLTVLMLLILAMCRFLVPEFYFGFARWLFG